MPSNPLDCTTEIHPIESDVSRVRSFVARVPGLQAAFLEKAESERELLLRAELRRTIDQLSGAFGEAASIENDSIQAAVLRAAALVAHELAGADAAVPAEH